MKSAKHWKPIGFRSHNGISLPLFALRSKKSAGIGEFLDLIPLIQWCSRLGFDCLELLPLNDTGDDPSPFNPISSCALDPIYLSLHPLGDVSSFSDLNQKPKLARTEVKARKMRWLRDDFENRFAIVSKTEEYQYFRKSHPWLPIYASFKTFEEEFPNTPVLAWPKRYGDPIHNQTLFDFHCFLQYLCFSQMQTVRKEASRLGIFLKGDMPILVNPHSADVWAYPHLFRTDLEAGSPPDAYNPLGQKWGFPLYDWDAMEEEGFAWWKTRLHLLESLYHIYRIDHVVGFFRIWAIPHEEPSIHGHFLPEDPLLWPSQGKRILEMMLDSCSLLPIAEDLGTIPAFLPPILNALGICGTKLLRWQYETDDPSSWIPYQKYNPFSMTTVSNADLDPLPLWWKKFPNEAKNFAKCKQWEYTPTLSHKHHLAILKDSHHTSSYFHINPLQEYLLLFPELVSPNLEDERINIPGTQNQSNWTYRFRPNLEDLITHHPLMHAIEAILENPAADKL